MGNQKKYYLGRGVVDIFISAFSRPLTRSHLLFVSAITILYFLFNASWLKMEHQWSVSSAHGHGYLIIPIAVWLIYRQRDQIIHAAIGTSFPGLAALLISSIVWLVGVLAGINVVSMAGVVAMVPSLVLLFYGPQVLRVLLFPLAFLFFMVPAGDFLVPSLMKATTDATVWAIEKTCIPVYREGNHISLPTGRWSVIETCAGLNYVLAASVLGALYAHLTFTRFYKQVTFFGTVVFVSLIANWIRAYFTLIIGHLTQMRWGPGHEHVTFGWALFGGIMLIMFWLGSRYRDVPRTFYIGKTDEPANCEYAFGDMNRRSSKINFSGDVYASFLGGFSALAILLCVKFLSNGFLLSSQIVEIDSKRKDLLGIESVGSMSFYPSFSGWRQKTEGRLNGGVGLFVGYYAHQTDGFELISSENRLISEDGHWVLISDNPYLTQDGGFSGFRVNEAIIRSAGRQVLVWYWYTSRQGVSTSRIKLKFDTLKVTLSGHGDKAAVTLISADYRDGGLDDARRRLSMALDVARQASGLIFD